MHKHFWESIHLNFSRLLSVLGDSERSALDVTIKDDALPAFIAKESSIGCNNGVGKIVGHRWKTRIPVFVLAMKVYSQRASAHRGRASISINGQVLFGFHSNAALLPMLNDVVHCSAIHGESDVGIRQKECQLREQREEVEFDFGAKVMYVDRLAVFSRIAGWMSDAQNVNQELIHGQWVVHEKSRWRLRRKITPAVPRLPINHISRGRNCWFHPRFKVQLRDQTIFKLPALLVIKMLATEKLIAMLITLLRCDSQQIMVYWATSI